ncbi:MULTISPECIES: flagellar basal body rod protein FlgC [Bacillales]|jgi:flagellar basal-body rod protein FlgC|uniref:Flagellar basal-body rod protein FlgC n=1 Tax=Brevibacillus aydinogluensis TaxID=927786 RepID=A0AA48MA42_9BACL|nr:MULTISPECIES: flagellar basal body rod protein FlgC [Bacillales]REK64217.1 MAG: flagellar basal body rod protein FlgC [Brevibacillus sp.]MBR8659499.1 flagellar basal body rod protein FlgC [Brevibacillus sp. NL20B1]MDT3415029.1 flagellar basal-body rod protein FlgC [Brevibacillus aydinogluensis]NNV01798.1 flagellar basal body rod protein FlgC [Brevibacillus sp. MCWH]UFJ60838.1 flagellar basal body rod protein FlgC [Anoxybacillus sediminis]
MSLFQGMDTSASALTANRLRLDTIAANIANANTTRATFVNGAWQPYKRKMVELSPVNGQSFDNLLQAAIGTVTGQTEQGVRVTAIREDNTPFKRMYDPTHPDADAEGYVLLPNVDVMKEMVDMISASRSYEANVTVLNAAKSMMMKALEIK